MLDHAKFYVLKRHKNVYFLHRNINNIYIVTLSHKNNKYGSTIIESLIPPYLNCNIMIELCSVTSLSNLEQYRYDFYQH